MDIFLAAVLSIDTILLALLLGVIISESSYISPMGWALILVVVLLVLAHLAALTSVIL